MTKGRDLFQEAMKEFEQHDFSPSGKHDTVVCRRCKELHNKALHADRSTGAAEKRTDSGCGKVS